MALAVPGDCPRIAAEALVSARKGGPAACDGHDVNRIEIMSINPPLTDLSQPILFPGELLLISTSGAVFQVESGG